MAREIKHVRICMGFTLMALRSGQSEASDWSARNAKVILSRLRLEGLSAFPLYDPILTLTTCAQKLNAFRFTVCWRL